MKVLISNLGKLYGECGGTAKITSVMTDELVKRGYDVSLVFADGRDGQFFYNINAKVKWFDLQDFRGEKTKYPLLLKLKRELYRIFGTHLCTQKVNMDFLKEYLSDNLAVCYDEIKPDVVITFSLDNTDIFVTKLRVDVPIITMCHGDPAYYFEDTPKDVLNAFRTSTVNQVLLPSHVEHIMKYMPDVNVVTIGNAVPQYVQQAELAREKKVYKVIFVGALIKRIKQPHIIIEAFAKLAKKYPEWIVELWGPEERKSSRLELEVRIKRHGLKNRVFIKGPTTNVPKVLEESDIFAFPSAFEGFGLALAEGLSMGLPGIGYKSCSGVNELIQDGYNGFLVDDGVEPFAQAMEKLMQDRNLRVKMGQHAHESMKKYAPEIIWQQWGNLLEQVVKGK